MSDQKRFKPTNTTRKVLRKRKLAPKRSLGQNFLVDENVYSKLLGLLRISTNDVVLEIGAGLGGLTKLLAKTSSSLIAIEKDDGLIEYLKENFGDNPDIEIHHADALEFDYNALRERVGRRMVAVSNLPYNIATPIIFRILEQRHSFKRLYLMVQLEVAERIVATPGGRDWGMLGIFCQVYTNPRIVLRVTPNSFYPAPEVHSAVVYFEMLAEPKVEDGNYNLFSALVKNAFSQRRKTLRNNFKGSSEFTPEEIAEASLITSIDLSKRAETLSIEDYAALTEAISRIREIKKRD